MAKKTAVIIGCGAIGKVLAKALVADLSGEVGEIYVYDADQKKMDEIRRSFSKIKAAKDMKDAVKVADIVLEAASPKVSGELLDMAVNAGKDVLIMSVGGLLDKDRVFEKARKKKVRILVPSGAISGIDALKAAKIGGLDSVMITTRKPPLSIKDAPYVKENNIDVVNIKGEKVVFDGNALQAVKGFPQNINVSAVLSLAGIGPEKTKVRIIVSPEYTKNTHEIEILGKSG
ncbi:MAG TPA: DUF108 domain-containing protein, partial [Candidatus Omnitrophota bacterium]|nr:DUF108 domain-containing protein [Candidatus Omnitrophota bacterium]